MKLYIGRRKATGKPVTPQYRQVLLNDAGDVVWSCTVWADSEKSEAEADILMTQYLDRIEEPVDLLEEA
tara:strand:+ start:537 stop:743 length:207 start_codon:yes stop_codon:yes gene_type:complete